METDKVDIDWSKAPEGATHYWEGSQCFYKFDKHGDDFVFCTDHWESCSDISCFSTEGLKLIPTEPKQPVYTQEMHNNNECPRLGVKFKVVNLEGDSRINDFNGLEVTVIGLSISECGKQVITFEHETRGVGCGIFRKFWVKPLPPKQELFDGKAYQFDYSGEEFVGVAMKGLFVVLAASGSSYHVEPISCTNITLLTPEEK